ncbi:MAG: reprolysin-like metallopeptidase [Bacteroidota bacterium]
MFRLAFLLASPALLLLVPTTFAQPSLWVEASASEAPERADLTTYRTVRFDLDALRGMLSAPEVSLTPVAMRLPLPEGASMTATIVETPVLAPSLQARYPDIRTYVVRGASSGRVAVTPHGVSGLLYDADGAIVIDPLGSTSALGLEYSAVYRASALVIPNAIFTSLRHDLAGATSPLPVSLRSAPIGETLRTYRLAVAATGEYTVSRGGTVAQALGAIAASVNRVNAFFERDLAVRFELVENNDQVIYTDPETDPFSPNAPDLLVPIQETIDEVIGDENYDVGHLIALELGGGLAFQRAACVSGFKAMAFSSVGLGTTPFDLLVFPHELGHQLGAPHTFVQPLPLFDPQPIGVEPGPGYTLMAYPYLATYRPESERVGFHFHSASVDSMAVFLESPEGSCGAATPTGNDLPVVSASESVTVPLGAFVTLDGTASDDSGTPLTYAWEQIDTFGDGTGAIPRVRALDPSPKSARTIPDLRRFLDSTPFTDESPLDEETTYAFQLTVRDNVPGGGAQATAHTLVRVRTSEGPFAITSVPPGTQYPVGSRIAVTWDVAGTNDGEIGVEAVDVLVSTDNGKAWTLVAEAVPNSGETTVTMPATPTMEGRLKVHAVGSPFFTVAEESFTLTGGVATADGATPDAEVVSAVWPNPASTQARVHVQLQKPGFVRATLYDALGRRVLRVSEETAASGASLRFDLSGLAAGVYAVRVESTARVETRQLVVVR